jgi:hypothetical protein
MAFKKGFQKVATDGTLGSRIGFPGSVTAPPKLPKQPAPPKTPIGTPGVGEAMSKGFASIRKAFGGT